MSADRFYITTPIFYPNGAPHIGHAYTAIAADAIARFARLEGRDVFFLSGTDEHGLKMKQTAMAEGISPLALADRNSARFRAMEDRLNVSYDTFIRTTEPRHHAACKILWERMAARGDIYKGRYGNWYSVRQEAFFDEKETTLGADGVRREPLGSPVEWVEEESYYFRLSAYQERLLHFYESHPEFIAPNERRNEVVSFVKGGLQDLSISRATLDWGIAVPGDPEHVMYVWIDALNNYVTATGLLDGSVERQRYWPADLHLIGKDIVRFHAVLWPAFLMSAGLELPRRVMAHGFLYNRGEKMSKSVGNVIDPFTLADLYGVDAFRYFLLREVPFGQDGSYSHEAIVGRLNADLANDLGNLAQRSLSMISKNCDGRIPQPGAFSPEDAAILAQAYALLGECRAAMADFQLHAALNAIWRVVAETNRYFAAQAPWALKKTDPARMATVLYVTAEVLRVIGLLIQPFMPESAAKLLDLLSVKPEARRFSDVDAGEALRAGIGLPEPKGIFPRYVEPEAGQGAG